MRKFVFFLGMFLSFGLRAQQGFVQNLGQWEDPSAFRMQMGANSVFLTPDSLVVSWLDPADFDSEHIGHHHHYSDTLHYHHFSLVFTGASKMNWIGEVPYPALLHYFVGPERRWRKGVKSFAKVIAKEVYPGIDLQVYEGPGGFKFDWIVGPGADPSRIDIVYNGLEGATIREKELHLQTRFGVVVEAMPSAYQESESIRIRYEDRSTSVGYKPGRYATDKPLVIDPLYIFSTYTGSTSDNFGYTATFDDNGNAFGGGIVWGSGYPTTLGAVDTVFNGGMFDVALSKFSSDGTQLLWSTYLGGSNLDQPYSLDCDENGDLYVLGSTGSSDFGVTSTAYDTSFDAGPQITAEYYTFTQGSDLFVAHISANGSQLVGSTYIGGAGNDGINKNLAFNYGDSYRGDIEVGRNGGHVYIASSTLSSSYPTLSLAVTHQGNQDGVLSVLNRNMTQLMASTYAGTSGDDALYSIALADKKGLSYPSTNWTYSPFFVAGSVGASSDTTFKMGWQNTAYSSAIAASSDQNALLLSGYINLSGIGFAASFVMDAVDVRADSGYNQHFFVEVNSETDTNSIVTVMGQHKGGLAHDSLLWGQPGSAQYFQEFKRNSNSGFDLRRTAVWGDGSHATVDVSPTALMVDDCGNTYFSGWGGSPNPEGNTNGLSTTSNAIQSTTDGRDLYFLVLDPNWKDARLATYFGGPGREHVDGGTSRFDREGRIFQAVCAGCGGASSYPTFPSNVWSTTNNASNCNLAVTVIDLDIQNARVVTQPNPPSFCLPDSFVLLDSSVNVQNFTIYWGDGNSSSGSMAPNNHIYASPGTYPVQVIGQDTVCDTWDTANFSITVNPPFEEAFTAFTYDFCDPNRSIVGELRSTVDSSLITDRVFEWSVAGANYSSSTFQSNAPTAGYTVVTLTAIDTVCNRVESFIDTLLFRLPPYLSIVSAVEECETGETVEFNPAYNGAYQGFEWLVDGQLAGSTNPLSISQSGLYEISLIGYDSICNTSDTISDQFDIYFAGAPFTVPNVITPDGDNINDRWTVNTTENWDAFHVILFNRWGIKVFETTASGFDWGADYNGEILSPGVYFYQVEAENRCGTITEEGTLHILY
jgi:gliding motility-associated-like protein